MCESHIGLITKNNRLCGRAEAEGLPHEHRSGIGLLAPVFWRR